LATAELVAAFREVLAVSQARLLVAQRGGGPDAKILLYMAQAVKARKVKIPIGRKLTLKDADEGHAAAAKGGGGKLLLVVDRE
jgi:hypothetical protein